MDRKTERGLIDEILGLKTSKALFLDEAATWNPIEHYTGAQRFERERSQVIGMLPNAVAHGSELARPGDFVTRQMAGRPLLVTRDKGGSAHTFLNVCRHRGTRLVDADKGCKHRFSCPYHAWTYANTGELIAAPHFEAGFPGADKSGLSLTRLACQERFGFIWVVPSASSFDWLEAYFEGLGPELEALGLGDMVVAAEDEQVRRANWKILVEGGIESYHFKIAHRSTIGPYFEDNLSTYQCFGAHLRSVLPRTSIASTAGAPREDVRLRDHANLLYTLFPTTQLLVQQDHIVWVKTDPLSADETALRLVTLVPKNAGQPTEHWTRNHRITMTTLDEDFVIGKSIQANARSGANSHMLFGRFEGALDRFNRTIDHFLNG